MATVEDRIGAAIGQPKKIEVDDQTVENHGLSELIEADRYLASKKAVRGRRFPVRFAKMAAGGSVE